MASSTAKAAPLYRYERKFVLEGASTATLLQRIASHPLLFIRPYPPRRVNNVYLDTPLLRDFFNNVDGNASRRNTRIRWYGDLFGPVGRARLEFKIKRGLVGTKQSFPLKPFIATRAMSSDIVRDILRQSDLPAEILSETTSLESSLINQYYRYYFASADGRFRLTLDEDVTFFPIATRAHSLLGQVQEGEKHILELKYAPEHEPQAHQVPDALGLRIARNSKYAVGIAACRFHGTLI